MAQDGEKSAKKRKAEGKAEGKGVVAEGADFMIQPEAVTPKLDTSRYRSFFFLFFETNYLAENIPTFAQVATASQEL
jgi:hypothetical protein